MKNNNDAKIFDRYAEDYDMLMKQNAGFIGKDLSIFARYKIRLAKSICSEMQPESLLEFGCGIGRNMSFIQEYFPQMRVLGCDTSEKSLEIASTHTTGVQYSAIAAPEDIKRTYQSGVDIILVACVLHHIDESEHQGWLDALFSVLRPGGKIIIFELNPFNPVTRRLFSTCPYDADAKLVYPKKARAALKSSGFLDIRHYYTVFFLWQSPFWSKLENLLRWLPLGAQYCLVGVK